MEKRISDRRNPDRIRRQNERIEQDVKENRARSSLDGVAAPVVGPHAQSLMRSGRRFYKMSGSGNDFIFFDEDDGPIDAYRSPIAIETLCAHGTGVGADGVVFFDRTDNAQLTITYYNSDG